MVEITKLTALLNKESGEVKFFKEAADAFSFKCSENSPVPDRKFDEDYPWDYFRGEEK